MTRPSRSSIGKINQSLHAGEIPIQSCGPFLYGGLGRFVGVKILYFDQFLQDWTGHVFNYAQSLRQAAEAEGIGFSIHANKAMTLGVRDALGARPSFDYTWRWAALEPFRKHPLLCWIPISIPSFINFLVRNVVFGAEFRKIEAGLDGEETVLFVPNWMGDVGIGLAWGLRRFLRRRNRRAVVLFRFPPEQRRFRVVARLLLPFHRAGRVRLVTDSEALAKLYREAFGVDFEVFPIPHSYPHAAEATTAPKEEPGRIHSFVHPGLLGLEKGFDTLVNALSLLEGELDSLPVRWQIQCYSNPFYLRDEPRARAALDRLTALAARHPSIVLLLEPLSPEAYEALIEGADLLLLTHRKHGYAARTSGACIEGLAMGKPIVTTEGTWLAEQAARFGVALFYRDGDPESLAQTLRRAVADLPALSREAHIGAPRCRAWHNPKTFLHLLLGTPEKS